ncbi:MAG: c-type cytochrome [Balneolaceae bacterium]
MSVTKQFLTGTGALTALILLLYLFFNLPSFDPAHSQTTLRFADSEAAAAHASRRPSPPPDYSLYQDLAVPPLSPPEALKTFQLEEGFRIELVAHEPAIIDPVAMDIDPAGHLWVVEMQSYMPVHDLGDEETSELERVPQSRIVVLEDSNGDGMMDQSHVFMDNLVLPRAIKVLESGVLFAEPPHVWFIQDTTGDGIGDTKEIVYDSYGNPDSGNVEHMPNGLMWGMDNWLHSSHNNVESLRYRNGEWLTRPFETLQQWGITQDDWGRLYSSHNSRTLTTHLVPYGYSDRHPHFSMQAGIYENIAESEEMWPAHSTGVNRGYQVGSISNEEGILLRSTATTGPVIYRGDQFGEEYRGNAFIPEPAGNLIKRLTGIDESPGSIGAEAEFAYREREFLTSTDERFRPVNIYNAPDGSLYVIDLYRGIFQHARFLTGHLREYAVEQGLHLPTGRGQFGRIYRIVREDREIDYNRPDLSKKSPEELVELLTHRNGWIRDISQQLLVQRSPESAVPDLEGHILNPSVEFYTRLQALWTLEGYDREQYPAGQLAAIALSAMEDPHPRIRAAAVRILEPELRYNNRDVIERLAEWYDHESDEYPKLQLLASLGESSDPEALSLMARIVNDHPESEWFREMALTGLYLREAEFSELLQTDFNWERDVLEEKDNFLDLLNRVQEETDAPPQQLRDEQLRLFNTGRQHYQTCAVCHGGQGEGVEGVAPPLAGSNWISGEPGQAVRIILHGFQGGTEDTGYPVAGAMPAHEFLSDLNVAALLTYLRQSWGNDSPPVSEEEVEAIRHEHPGRSEAWTPEELRELVE